MKYSSIRKLLLIVFSTTAFLYGGKIKRDAGSNPFEPEKCSQDVLDLYNQYCSRGHSVSDTINLAIYYHVARAHERVEAPVVKNREEYDALSEVKRERIKSTFIKFCSFQKKSKKQSERNKEIQSKLSFVTSYFSIIYPEQWQRIQDLNKELSEVEKNKGKGKCGSNPNERSRLWHARQQKKNAINKDLLETLNRAALSIEHKLSLVQPVLYYPVFMFPAVVASTKGVFQGERV